MKNLLICLSLALMVFGCESNTATSSDKTMEEVTDAFTPAQIAAQTKVYEDMMDAHDRVMPRMGQIAQLQKAIKDATGLDEKIQMKLAESNTQLEGAYDGMMEWMKNLKSMDDLREMGDHDKIMSYVNTELGNMTKIEKMLNSGIAETQELLGIKVEAAHDDHGHDHDHSDKDHNHKHEH